MTPADILRRLCPNGSTRDQIDVYYEARGLRTPNAKEALFWLVSEVGELVEAWLIQDRTMTPNGDRAVLIEMVMIGKRADVAVSAMQGDWMRNFQPAGTVDIPGEGGDVYMMLDRLLKAFDLPAPEDCWKSKANRKLRRPE